MTSRINPDPTGNRRDKLKKPATESTSVQGNREYEELYFSDRIVHRQGMFQPLKTIGYSPMVGIFLHCFNQEMPEGGGPNYVQNPL